MKLFDEDHEEDLQDSINAFLSTLPDTQFIDIKYTMAMMSEPIGAEPIYSYSAMLIYRK